MTANIAEIAFAAGMQKAASAGAELAGLGVLAAPSIAKMRGKHVSEKTEHRAEIGGLGILAAGTLHSAHHDPGSTIGKGTRAIGAFAKRVMRKKADLNSIMSAIPDAAEHVRHAIHAHPEVATAVAGVTGWKARGALESGKRAIGSFAKRVLRKKAMIEVTGPRPFSLRKTNKKERAGLALSVASVGTGIGTILRGGEDWVPAGGLLIAAGAMGANAVCNSQATRRRKVIGRFIVGGYGGVPPDHDVLSAG